MTTDRKRAPAVVGTDRAGLCRATNKRGEPCRKQAAKDGLCLVHSGEQDMRAIGREGGRAIPKAKRREPDGERPSLRDFLREQADPAKVWEAIQSGLASTNERDKLAAAKLLLAELYEPAAERSRVDEAEAAEARQVVMHRLDVIARRRVLEGLVEAGVIRPGAGQPFEGVVMFELRELAEWAGHWTPRPLEVSDVACSTCGKAGVRTVAEGETVDGGPVYCATCEPAAEEAKAEEEASIPAPGPAYGIS